MAPGHIAEAAEAVRSKSRVRDPEAQLLRRSVAFTPATMKVTGPPGGDHQLDFWKVIRRFLH